MTLRAGPRFYRAHGLGNDYLVFESDDTGEESWTVEPAQVRIVCARASGVGSDGIVALVDRSPQDGIFPLRMFNPDGSEFERSGNGLRVLASYLFRESLVGEAPFRVRTGGSLVGMTVHSVDSHGRYDISVEMGRARVGLEAVGADASLLEDGPGARHPQLGPLPFVPVSVGNPHAVVFPDAEDLPVEVVGPFLARHPAFARGTNVQIARVTDADRLRIGIWERGVGPTSASGTSACASAVAAVHTGRIAPGHVTVEMPGGAMSVKVTPELDVTLRGPVDEVEEGRLTDGFLTSLAKL